MTAALIVVAVAALLAAGVAAGLARRARAASAAAAARAAAAEGQAAAAELRRRRLSDLVPLVALRLDGAGKVVEANRLAMDRFGFVQPGMSVLDAFSEHTLAGAVS